MAFVKMKRDSHGYSSGYLYNALNYLYDNEKLLHIGGYGVVSYDLNKTYEQMVYIKDYFHKSQDNPLLYFIVSFGDEVCTYEKAKAFAVLIVAFFGCKYQLLWALHKKHRGDSMFHIHFIVNPVSFVDSKLYNSSRENMSNFCNHIERVTGSNCRYYFADYDTTNDV